MIFLSNISITCGFTVFIIGIAQRNLLTLAIGAASVLVGAGMAVYQGLK